MSNDLLLTAVPGVPPDINSPYIQLNGTVCVVCNGLHRLVSVLERSHNGGSYAVSIPCPVCQRLLTEFKKKDESFT